MNLVNRNFTGIFLAFAKGGMPGDIFHGLKTGIFILQRGKTNWHKQPDAHPDM
jgi:hypothetical protein